MENIVYHISAIINWPSSEADTPGYHLNLEEALDWIRDKLGNKNATSFVITIVKMQENKR